MWVVVSVPAMLCPVNSTASWGTKNLHLIQLFIGYWCGDELNWIGTTGSIVWWGWPDRRAIAFHWASNCTGTARKTAATRTFWPSQNAAVNKSHECTFPGRCCSLFPSFSAKVATIIVVFLSSPVLLCSLPPPPPPSRSLPQLKCRLCDINLHWTVLYGKQIKDMTSRSCFFWCHWPRVSINSNCDFRNFHETTTTAIKQQERLPELTDIYRRWWVLRVYNEDEVVGVRRFRLLFQSGAGFFCEIKNNISFQWISCANLIETNQQLTKKLLNFFKN